jgi:hypothetical protein
MKSPRSIFFAAFALPFVSRTAAADPSALATEAGYGYAELETARSLAMGGAVRAFGNSNTALYANPANMALTRAYHLDALVSIWPEPRKQTYGASAVDSMTNRLAGGIGASYGVLDPDGLDRKWTDVRLALAYPFSDKLFAGLGGRYLKLYENGAGRYSLSPSAASAGLTGDAVVNGFSFDAGLTFKPGESFAIGLTGQNLSYPRNGLSPTSVGGGVGYANDDLTIEGDLLFDLTTYVGTGAATRSTVRGMLGVEYLAADHYPLRAGYRYDQGLKSHALSAGFGYLDPQFALEIALRRTVSGPEWSTPVTAIVIDLEYFLEGSGTVRGGAYEQD